MEDCRTIATWEDDGTRYTVTLLLDGNKPTGLTIEATMQNRTRRCMLPIEYGSLEYYEEAWSDKKPPGKLTIVARRVFAAAEQIDSSG